jgi:biotin-dependent carboxylase-like uncharacterized protein
VSARIEILRAAPLTTIQDAGRPGTLRYGIAASGPMDRAAFVRAAGWLGTAGRAGLEFTRAGLDFAVIDGTIGVAADGGDFTAVVNDRQLGWPTRAVLRAGDRLSITPGQSGNYGYLRFDAELDLMPVLGSMSTNLTAGLGGVAGRGLVPGDRLTFGDKLPTTRSPHPQPAPIEDGPLRILWGLHADLFPAAIRQRFLTEAFTVSARLDRMGVGLDDPHRVFEGWTSLSLISDAIVPGDIQILGNGTPTVLMRDHQPVGGYPRIATILSADLDRFAQLRPGTAITFTAVSPDHARRILEGTAR